MYRGEQMYEGDLVQVWNYSPHSSDPKDRVSFTGIFLDYERMEPDGGWIVLIDGKLEIFTRTWWKCQKIQNNK